MGSRFRNQLAVDVATLVPGVKEKERGREGGLGCISFSILHNCQQKNRINRERLNKQLYKYWEKILRKILYKTIRLIEPGQRKTYFVEWFFCYFGLYYDLNIQI